MYLHTIVKHTTLSPSQEFLELVDVDLKDDGYMIQYK